MVDPKVTSITPESSAAIDRKKLWGGIFFLPYGTNLLTVNAMYWILPMWVVATVMAGTEGMAWYEMAQKFSAGHTLLALVVAIGLGGIIWMVDATFIMFDIRKNAECGTGRFTAPARSAVTLDTTFFESVASRTRHARGRDPHKPLHHHSVSRRRGAAC